MTIFSWIRVKDEFSYFSPKTYVLGTQKKLLDETNLFEHPKHILKLIDKKIITILCDKCLQDLYEVNHLYVSVYL